MGICQTVQKPSVNQQIQSNYKKTISCGRLSLIAELSCEEEQIEALEKAQKESPSNLNPFKNPILERRFRSTQVSLEL